MLAIARHEYYNKLSLTNTIKTEILVPTRGQILDRNNEPLAINELGFTVALKNLKALRYIFHYYSLVVI